MKIGSKIKLIGGGTPNKEIEEYWGGNIPWVSVKDLKSDYITSTIDKITDLGVKNSVAKIVKKGTLLISTRMAVGKTAIAGVDLAFNQDIKAIQHNEEIDTKFLHYFLKSKQTYFESISSGATVKGIKIQDILNIQIPLPPLDAQKRIATLLDTADSLRQKDKAVLQKYDALAQSLFLELFGDPVRNEKGWEKKSLKEVTAKIGSGNTPKGGSNVYVEDGIVFLRSQNVWKNRIDLEDVAFIDFETHQKMKNSSLKYGDILMTKTGRFNTENSSLGRAALYLGKDDAANLNGHVYLIRLKKTINKEFVLFILTTDSYKQHIRNVCVGGIDKRQLNKEHLEDFPIICPPIELQNQFAEQIQLIEKQKALVQENLKKSEALFLGLLGESFEVI